MSEDRLEAHQREDKRRKEEWGATMANWRSWGSWFSWGSPVGLGIWFVCTALALAILLSSVAKFVAAMGWVG